MLEIESLTTKLDANLSNFSVFSIYVCKAVFSPYKAKRQLLTPTIPILCVLSPLSMDHRRDPFLRSNPTVTKCNASQKDQLCNINSINCVDISCAISCAPVLC